MPIVQAALPASQNAVDDLQVGTTSGLDNIRAGAMSAIALAVEFHRNRSLTLGVFTDGGTMQFELFQYQINAGRIQAR